MCGRGPPKVFFLESLNDYYPLAKWSTVMLMFILKCVLGFQRQRIEFKNAFAKEYIAIYEQVFIEVTRYLRIYGWQRDVIIRFKKTLYFQSKDTRIWYKKFLNGLLDYGFVVSKVDNGLLISKTVICVACVDDYLFW